MDEKEYIERNTAIEALTIDFWEHYSDCHSSSDVSVFEAMRDSISEIPAADVVEVRHGEWKLKAVSGRPFDGIDETMYVLCPYCERSYSVPNSNSCTKIVAYAREHYPYCNCGAKMDGGKANGCT